MIKIRNESDLQNWFKKNYKKLGFSDIIKYDSQRFPDFIMLENGKEVRIELEIKASNFLLHKHPKNKVDRVICIEKDVELGIPTLELKNFELVSPLLKSPYSIPNQIYNFLKNEEVITTSEVARKLKLNWGTAERGLMELVMDNKIERIKKKGVNLWMLK